MTARDARPSRPHDTPPRARTLRALDPTELLAQITLGLQDAPRDSLALVGHRDRCEVVVTTRSELWPLAGEDAAATLDHLIGLLRREGCTGAFGLVVLGDGRGPTGDASPAGPAPLGGPVEEPADEAAGIRLAVRVLVAARTEGFDIPELWVLAHGRAREVVVSVPAGPLEPGTPIDIGISDPVALGDVGSTLVAAESVLAGEQRRVDGRTAVAPLRSLLLAGAGRAQPRPLPRPAITETWNIARASLRALDGPVGTGDPERWMTACEHVRSFVVDLASPPRRDDFLVRLLGRGQDVAALADGDLTRLVEDPRCRPHESIRAGGAWYEALREMEAVTRPPVAGSADEGDAELRAGWANLATVLALAAWWNHRFATAGALTDEVLHAVPDHSLARLVAVMAAGPVQPGWDPRPST